MLPPFNSSVVDYSFAVFTDMAFAFFFFASCNDDNQNNRSIPSKVWIKDDDYDGKRASGVFTETSGKLKRSAHSCLRCTTKCNTSSGVQIRESKDVQSNHAEWSSIGRMLRIVSATYEYTIES